MKRTFFAMFAAVTIAPAMATPAIGLPPHEIWMRGPGTTLYAAAEDHHLRALCIQREGEGMWLPGSALTGVTNPVLEDIVFVFGAGVTADSRLEGREDGLTVEIPTWVDSDGPGGLTDGPAFVFIVDDDGVLSSVRVAADSDDIRRDEEWLPIDQATLRRAPCVPPPAAAQDDLPRDASTPRFEVEEDLRLTAGNNIPFSGGETLHFDVWGLAPNEILFFDRCGEGCNSAKNIFRLPGNPDRSPRFQSVELSEPGKYYFWVQRANAEGESGPLQIGKSEQDDEGFRAAFGSDVHVLVRISNSDDVPPPAFPPRELLSGDPVCISCRDPNPPTESNNHD